MYREWRRQDCSVNQLGGVSLSEQKFPLPREPFESETCSVHGSPFELGSRYNAEICSFRTTHSEINSNESFRSVIRPCNQPLLPGVGAEGPPKHRRARIDDRPTSEAGRSAFENRLCPRQSRKFSCRPPSSARNFKLRLQNLPDQGRGRFLGIGRWHVPEKTAAVARNGATPSAAQLSHSSGLSVHSQP